MPGRSRPWPCPAPPPGAPGVPRTDLFSLCQRGKEDRRVQLSKYNFPLNNGPQTCHAIPIFYLFFKIQINLLPWHSKGRFYFSSLLARQEGPHVCRAFCLAASSSSCLICARGLPVTVPAQGQGGSRALLGTLHLPKLRQCCGAFWLVRGYNHRDPETESSLVTNVTGRVTISGD